MKTLRKMKKGFTIVELVIVIAVIAVLTAILVPTFISISNKANEASDKSLVKNLNTALRMAEGDQGKKNDTMHDAVLDVEKFAGIKLSQYVSKSGDEILWDSVADEFVWKTAKPEGRADHLLWTIAKSYDSSAQTFSMYAGHEWTVTSVAGLKVGLDVGFHEDIESIEYVGTGSAKTVTIRTYGGTLSINAPTDTVKRFGYLEHLNVIAVSTLASYHEFGFLKKLDNFGSGHFVAESTAEFEESREALLTTIGSNTSNLGSLPANQFDNDDPYAPVVIHDLTPEDIAAQAQGNKVLVDGTYRTGMGEQPFYVASAHTIKLIDNIQLDGLGLLGGASVTIDLNGYQLILTDAIYVTEGGTVTIQDSSSTHEAGVWASNVPNLGYGLIAMDGTLNIYGGTFDATGFGGNVIGYFGPSGSAHIYGGRFIADAGNSCMSNLSTIDIQGGTFNATAAGSTVFGFKESQKSVDYSKATIVPGSTIYRAE